MTILVTGACGSVGAHVVAALARRCPGEAILATDLAPPPASVAAYWGAGRIAFQALDVTDAAAVAAAMAEARPRFVVHMAAVTPSPAMEAAHPRRVVEVNIGGAANVLDAATVSPGIERVVVLSSGAVYGFSPALPSPVTEDAPVDAVGLYAVSKAAAEGLARRFGGLRGVSTAAVRVAAVYGAMERPTAHRETMSQVYPLFAALRDRRPVAVAPSEAVRDWTHADDVGDGIAALLAAPTLRHSVYNLSRGIGLPWSEVIALFREAGLDICLTDDPAEAEASFDPALARPPLANARLAADTGFRPERDLKDAVAEAAGRG